MGTKYAQVLELLSAYGRATIVYGIMCRYELIVIS